MSNPNPEDRDIVREISIKDFPKDKEVSITLMWGMFCHAYQVKAITDTTYYHPGQWMDKAVAQELCNLPHVTVTMVDDDILNFITAAVGAATAVKAVPGIL